MNYTEEQIVRIAKRENNNKRKYLVVNALQGKHIPVSGKQSLEMFNTLARKVREAYSEDEKLLLIGFCETATAIGCALAIHLRSYYMQTTRETIDNVNYLYFSEEHSHATEQKLAEEDIRSFIGYADRIIFVEDEITTGNTILNIIHLLEQKYRTEIKFSAASILNGMDEKSMEIYAQRNITLHYLVKTDHTKYTEIAETFSGDGRYYPCHTEMPEIFVEEYSFGDYLDTRRVEIAWKYRLLCELLWYTLCDCKDLQEIFRKTGQKILVLGTEEFMYPSIYIACQLEKNGNEVKCHSTTRSPIAVSAEENYPLHERFSLVSLYDDSRQTFIYNLEQYDEVLIITDSTNKSRMGINSLANALAEKGNQKIRLIRWCNEA